VGAAQPVGDRRSLARRATAAAGTTFLVAGCLGFLPGATADLERLHLTGPGSPSALLGLVPVTVAGNLIHLAFAVVALWCVASESRARRYLVWGGSSYAVLCARSLVIGTGSVGESAGADGGLWLALAAGVAMTTVGVLAVGGPMVGWAPATGIRHPG
jgi:hypothetical protein